MIRLGELLTRHAQDGRIDWIGLRPERHAPLVSVERARITEAGLDGDHGRPGKRAVTLLQAEHVPVIAGLSGHAEVTPATLRRNLVISGLNLTALRGAVIGLGTSQRRLTTVCAPCSRMDTGLGYGGYSARRGHGGWCAEGVVPGEIAVGDAVRVIDAAPLIKP